MSRNSISVAAGAVLLTAGAAWAETCGAGTACSLPAGEYHVVTPDGDGPHPAVVVLHDAGGSAAALVEAEAIATSALSRGYAVVAPQGLDQIMADGSAQPGWRLSGTRSGGRDDISFLERVLSDAADAHGIDPARVLVTGYGHGGALTWEAACEHPSFAAAFAPRNGGYFGDLPAACAGSAKVLHLHAPVDGGWPLAAAVETAEGVAPYVPVQAHLTLAAETFGCAGTGGDTALPAGWDAVVWNGCADGAALKLVLHPETARTSALQIDVMIDWFEMDRMVTEEGAAAVAATLDAEATADPVPETSAPESAEEAAE
ncbi:MAG: dienelactone hydrolase family protein [Pseudomonadota bacterium]